MAHEVFELDGIEEKPFYQKRVPAKRPQWLQTAVISFPSGRTAEELVPVDAARWRARSSAAARGWRPRAGGRRSARPARCSSTTTRTPRTTRYVGSLDSLLALAQRDSERGIPDAPSGEL
jgi:hypothetical protein